MARVSKLIFPTNSRRKVWILDSLELHELALRRYLGGTKYRHWKGIFESVYFFGNLSDGWWHPFNDPHHPLNYGTIFLARAEPMLTLNRLCKAFWEFGKSIRIFMRCAIMHRQSNDPTAEPHHFWVWHPFMRVSTYRFIDRYLKRFHNIDTQPVDPNGRPLDNLPLGVARVSFFMNLLQHGAWAEEADWQIDRLCELRQWMFDGGLTQNPGFIAEMVENDELADPPMVSYAYPIAVVPYDELEQSNLSPEILPGTTNELGDLGINFVNAVTI